MKLLLDTCLSSFAKADLVNAGHDVVWTGDLSVDPGDDAILAQAHHEQRILVTLDKDFGTFAVLRKLPHAGIIRLSGIRARQQAALCMHVLVNYGPELAQGAIITAEPGHIRVRLASAP